MKNLYLGRRVDSNKWYEIGKSAKSWNKKYGFVNSFLHHFYAHEFETIFGITLEPGELRKIKSIKIELED